MTARTVNELARQGQLVEYITVKQYNELPRRIYLLELRMADLKAEQGPTPHLRLVESK